MLKKEEDVCNVFAFHLPPQFFFFPFLLFHVFFRVFKTRGFRKAFEVFGGEKRRSATTKHRKNIIIGAATRSECIRLLSAVITGKYDSLALSSCAIWWLAGDRFVRTRAEGCDCRASVISAVLSFASSRRFFSTKTMDDERRCSFYSPCKMLTYFYALTLTLTHTHSL